MSTDFKIVKKQFSKSMSDYNQNAIVQAFMADVLVKEIANLCAEFENILEIGAGTGLATEKIVKSLNFKNYYANDLVEKSKNYIKNFVPEVNFFCGNALKIKTHRKFDLIVSNAMFQWFDRLDVAVEYFNTMLNQNGILAFSTFSPQNFKEISEITGLSLNYHSVSQINEILIDKGFKIKYTDEFCKKLSFNNPLELLRHMKKTGVNSLEQKTWTIKDVKVFCDKYNKINPQTILTYTPIVVVAQKI